LCYSAEVQEDYRWYIRTFGAKISIADFVHLYTSRLADSKIRIAKAMDAAFAQPRTADEQAIKALIDEYDASQAAKLEQELFKQKKRLADAERTLKAKVTKKAQDDQRIATNKIAWAKGKLDDLRRTQLKTRTRASSPAGTRQSWSWRMAKRS
jgi:hypothetical protein